MSPKTFNRGSRGSKGSKNGHTNKKNGQKKHEILYAKKIENPTLNEKADDGYESEHATVDYESTEEPIFIKVSRNSFLPKVNFFYWYLAAVAASLVSSVYNRVMNRDSDDTGIDNRDRSSAQFRGIRSSLGNDAVSSLGNNAVSSSANGANSNLLPGCREEIDKNGGKVLICYGDTKEIPGCTSEPGENGKTIFRCRSNQ